MLDRGGEGIARRMLKFLEGSEAAKVSIGELEAHVLSPIVRTASQARNDNWKICFRSSDKEKMKSTSLVRRDGTNK